MKKYNVSYSEIAHYLTKVVEAENEEEARDQFIDMLNEGMVEVNKTDMYNFEVKEIKEQS